MADAAVNATDFEENNDERWRATSHSSSPNALAVQVATYPSAGTEMRTCERVFALMSAPYLRFT